MRPFVTSSILGLASLLIPALHGFGAPVVWTLDSTRSLVSLSGSMVSGDVNAPSLTIALQPGGFAPYSEESLSNSLETRLDGTITFEYSSSADTIRFLAANLVANNGGSYRPNNFAASATSRSPANLGGRIDIPALGGADLAVRQLVASITSGLIPMSGPDFDWTFSSTAQTLGLTQGRIDYSGSGSIGGALGTGTFDLIGKTSTNSSTVPGRLTLLSPTFHGIPTLFVPIDLRFSQTILGSDTPESTDDIFVDLHLAGELVAYHIPEASSLVMLGALGLTAGMVGYRRRGKNTPPLD